eukprot:6264784-Pyramimonas_sp.AAC.1
MRLSNGFRRRTASRDKSTQAASELLGSAGWRPPLKAGPRFSLLAFSCAAVGLVRRLQRFNDTQQAE